MDDFADWVRKAPNTARAKVVSDTMGNIISAPPPIISQGHPQWQSMIDTDVAHELSITKDKSEYVRSVGGQTESLFISSNHPSHTSAGSLDHKIITSNTCPKYVTVQNNI